MHSRQILVVDESPLLAALSSAMMTRSRSSVTRIDVARSATDALKLHRLKSYDLVLVNCEANALDSLDVLRQLRNADFGTEAVVVSGWVTPGLIERGQELGVTRFYRLPGELMDLTHHLNTFKRREVSWQ